MCSKISNPTVAFLVVLFSSCYLSREVSQSKEVDDDNPSAIGGNPSAFGGNPSIEIDEPLVDAGIEEASLLGAWRGRLMSENSYGKISILDGWAFEFTDTRVVISFADVELGGANYSINRNVNPYQLELNIESVNEDLIGPLTEEEIEMIKSVSLFSAIFRIENGVLTIAMSAMSPSPPRSFDLGEDGSKLVFELTSDR